MSSKSKSNPKHIAIIMDGNGRWANSQGKERTAGHESGLESVKEAIKGCISNGVSYLTLYAFSTENWKRPKEEVDFLMELMVIAIERESAELIENGVKVEQIGDPNLLPPKTREALGRIKNDTAKGEKLTLIVALNYGSREEIVRAVRSILEKVDNKKIDFEDIDENLISQSLDTHPFPDPDIMIRTSSEYRLSNFLLWQMAYTEFFFIEKMWPEFKKEDIDNCIDDYMKRERRYGMTGNQVK